jgi:hypothetical protein
LLAESKNFWTLIEEGKNAKRKWYWLIGGYTHFRKAVAIQTNVFSIILILLEKFISFTTYIE